MVAAIGCGNYGDLTSAVIAREMGLPFECIVAGQNGNNVFHRLLETNEYEIKAVQPAPSYAMVVAAPNNMPRLFDLYHGQMDGMHKVVRQPDFRGMRRDFRSAWFTEEMTYAAMKDAYNCCGAILDPHGGVAWGAMELCSRPVMKGPKVVYDTASPSKFPDEVMKAIGITPPVPEIFEREAVAHEVFYEIFAPADRIKIDDEETPVASDAQYGELKEILRQLAKMR